MQVRILAKCLVHGECLINEIMMVTELDKSHGSATKLLCDLGQIPYPLWASVPPPPPNSGNDHFIPAQGGWKAQRRGWK